MSSERIARNVDMGYGAFVGSWVSSVASVVVVRSRRPTRNGIGAIAVVRLEFLELEIPSSVIPVVFKA